jgi:hypothetical protein
LNGITVGERDRRDCEPLERWLHGIAMAHGPLLDDPQAPLLSLLHDTAMMFGDELIARYPSLSWQLKRAGPRAIHYQSTVLMGYSRASKNYSAELIFSHIIDLNAEFFGAERRPRWVGLLRIAEESA